MIRRLSVSLSFITAVNCHIVDIKANTIYELCITVSPYRLTDCFTDVFYCNKYLKTTEQFSIECPEAKTKVITLANHNRLNSVMNQSELEAKTCNRCQARENAREKVARVMSTNHSVVKETRNYFRHSNENHSMM